MAFNQPAVSRTAESALATNKVLRNTYSLLSMTLLFSALMAALSIYVETGPGTYLLSVGGALLLIWLVLPRTANSAAGIWVVFGITGLLGFSLGPIMAQYLALSNGPQLVMTALGGTGVIFLGLSGYALTTKRDFSFLGGMLFVGLLVILFAALANIFFAVPALSLAISAAVIILFSGFILYDTSRIINGGETNYLMATVALYLNIFNIFIHLLNLLGALSNND